MGSSLEIERKFRLPDPPREPPVGEAHIEQGYLATLPDEELRIRRQDSSCTLTVKSGHGAARGEHEIEISDDLFAALWALTEGRRIAKTRSEFEVDGHVVEVDVYEGHLTRLVIAEIEFDSEEDARRFDPHSWMGVEVTGDDAYSNAALAQRRFTEPGRS